MAAQDVDSDQGYSFGEMVTCTVCGFECNYLEPSLLSFEKLDRASPDLWPEQIPGVSEFAASFNSPITSSPPKWLADLEKEDIDMLQGSWRFISTYSLFMMVHFCFISTSSFTPTHYS
uniref:Protein lin-52 homolog n=1 Tax=Eptatretus burgeri TaxID=7764 RepID=A0A8C4QN58_EPTBU